MPDEILMLQYPSFSVCIWAMYPVHFAHNIKSFTQSFNSSCVLKTKCYPIGLFTNRMHCPFLSCLAGSTSHACFKALIWQHSYLWNLTNVMRTRHMRVNSFSHSLHYCSRFGVLMPIECLLIFRVKTAVHWAASV